MQSRTHCLQQHIDVVKSVALLYSYVSEPCLKETEQSYIVLETRRPGGVGGQGAVPRLPQLTPVWNAGSGPKATLDKHAYFIPGMCERRDHG